MDKPVVLYENPQRIEIGFPAIIYPLNHPSRLVTNSEYAITSMVVAITDDGFETENTIYRHEEK